MTSPTASGWNLTERLAGYGGYNGEHITQFANRVVQTVQPDTPLGNPKETAYALRCDYDEDHNAIDLLDRLLEQTEPGAIEALVFGLWGSGEEVCTGDESSKLVVDGLVARSQRLPNLKAVFIGDITYEECEISWLVQSDMSPLLKAYPQLEILQVRGGDRLTFNEPGTHNHLKALIIETGGLSRDTVQQLYRWKFPALNHLELWFGSEDYGGNCWDRDLPPILDGLCFPRLDYLGLRNSKFANEMMERLVRSPLLERLQILDLSMGTLGDEGATQLLNCRAIQDLQTLNVSESYLSEGMVEQLRSLNITLLADEQRLEEDDEDPAYRRYCVVSE
ncbi:MAG: STM4015 family protein [Cyanobacteria bacterium P01_F01_bin.150]